MITQKRIAEKAGVSFATVSRALTRSANVKPATMQRIRGAMQELGITNSDDLFLGKSLLTRTVMVIIGSVQPLFFAELLTHICKKLAQYEYTVVLVISDYSAPKELSALRTAEENGYAGAIMATAIETPELVGFLQNCEIPVVMVNRYIRSMDLDVVRIDNYRGGYIAGRYLIAHGHRKIAHLGGPAGISAPEDRLRGFSDALQDNAIPFSEKDVMYGDLTRESGKRFADWLISRDYTAAYIGNDIMAAGCVYQLNLTGKTVPDFISIICFDDSPLVNEEGLNITSVSGDPMAMGQAVAATLIQRIGDPLGRRMRTIFSPELRERGSVRNPQEDK